MMSTTRNGARLRRHRRVRQKISGTPERPRLTVFRSNRHVYAQLIDDEGGRTVAAASTKETGIGATGNATKEAAKNVGKRIAERARDAGIESVVFDRSGYRYHGQVAAVADGVREAGLKV
jgi:large subunit ribosomal protein L18